MRDARRQVTEQLQGERRMVAAHFQGQHPDVINQKEALRFEFRRERLGLRSLRRVQAKFKPRGGLETRKVHRGRRTAPRAR